jgi:hypothetical protein
MDAENFHVDTVREVVHYTAIRVFTRRWRCRSSVLRRLTHPTQPIAGTALIG